MLENLPRKAGENSSHFNNCRGVWRSISARESQLVSQPSENRQYKKPLSCSTPPPPQIKTQDANANSIFRVHKVDASQASPASPHRPIPGLTSSSSSGWQWCLGCRSWQHWRLFSKPFLSGFSPFFTRWPTSPSACLVAGLSVIAGQRLCSRDVQSHVGTRYVPAVQGSDRIQAGKAHTSCTPQTPTHIHTLRHTYTQTHTLWNLKIQTPNTGNNAHKRHWRRKMGRARAPHAYSGRGLLNWTHYSHLEGDALCPCHFKSVSFASSIHWKKRKPAQIKQVKSKPWLSGLGYKSAHNLMSSALYYRLQAKKVILLIFLYWYHLTFEPDWCPKA